MIRNPIRLSSMTIHFPMRGLSILASITACPAAADAPADNSTNVVTGSRVSQLGVAESANAGVVTAEQLATRTVYRPGELLEATPGLIVSQHSGEGKANQFYLRGFNLDHGTDLRTSIDGMLVNQRSHSHGQGWTDVNFLIPRGGGSTCLSQGLIFSRGRRFRRCGISQRELCRPVAKDDCQPRVR